MRPGSAPKSQWRTVRLVIGFQGTRYEGWQSQKKQNTLQEVIEKELERILGHKTDLIGSSRTDSGVHAEALVAHLKTSKPITDAALKRALNFYLPKDILVRSAKTMPNTFHARYGAKSKLYRYKIWNNPTRPLFEAPFVLWHPYKLDVAAMKKAATYFIGKHDFASFKDGNEEKKTTVRTIRKLRITRKAPLIAIDVQGDGFLRHMVRILIGTLLEVGRGKIAPEQVKTILKTGDRKLAGPTAKSHGLSLLKVLY